MPLSADQKALLGDLTNILTYDRLTFICADGQVTAHKRLLLFRAPAIIPRITCGSHINISWAPSKDVQLALDYLQFAAPITYLSSHSRMIARWFAQPALCCHIVRAQLAGIDPALDAALDIWQPDQAFFQGGPPTFYIDINTNTLRRLFSGLSFDRIPNDEDHLMANVIGPNGASFRIRHRIPDKVKYIANARKAKKIEN